MERLIEQMIASNRYGELLIDMSGLRDTAEAILARYATGEPDPAQVTADAEWLADLIGHLRERYGHVMEVSQ